MGLPVKGITMDEEHQRFTVDATAYLRNLNDEDLQSECIAISHQSPPVKNDNGSTSLSLRFPTLIVTEYVANKREIAERIAQILNAHWHDGATT